jgi:hypothetical protein
VRSVVDEIVRRSVAPELETMLAIVMTSAQDSTRRAMCVFDVAHMRLLRARNRRNLARSRSVD